MEQNFQTSFIPKKPILEEKKKVTRQLSVGLFTIASVFVFFTFILGSGGLFFLKIGRQNSLAEMQKNLNLAKNRFEPSRIAELKTLDRRLIAGTEVLSNHVAISPIFQALGDITMKSIRYTKFTYSINESKKIEVKMSGQAVGYRDVAQQADLFSKNKYFIDPVFSGLNLDQKGNVVFDLNFSVDPNFVNYEQKIKIENEVPGGEVPADISDNSQVQL